MPIMTTRNFLLIFLDCFVAGTAGGAESRYLLNNISFFLDPSLYVSSVVFTSCIINFSGIGIQLLGLFYHRRRKYLVRNLFWPKAKILQGQFWGKNLHVHQRIHVGLKKLTPASFTFSFFVSDTSFSRNSSNFAGD